MLRPEPHATENLMTAEDPLTIIPADESELSSTSVHGSEHLYGRDRNAKASVSINDGETSSILSVRQFCLNGKNIIIFSDLCQVVLKTWGSYNNLYNMLKKHGIKTCRFDHLQLRILKNSGFVNLQVKNCSFITEKDFNQILLKYDEENNTDHAKRIQLSSPIVIDNLTNSKTEFESNQGGKKYHDILPVASKTSSQSTTPSIINMHSFSIGDQDFVTLSEVYRLFENKFRRPDLLNLVLQNLKIDVCKLTANEMLSQVDTDTGVMCNDTLRGLYITRKDFERVLQYTSALLDTSPAAVSSGQLETLSTSVAIGENNTEVHDPAEFVSNSPSTTSETPVLSETGNFLESETAKESNSVTSCVIIRTCLVEGEVVVCVPDLRKVVIDLYGQSVQVGSFMHRLGIPTHRFSSMILKHLKGHNILSSRATLCTYITRADAERLLKMYHMCNRSENQSEDPPRIEWSEPIILENNFNTMREDHLESPRLQQCIQAALKIPLFIINQQVVVAMPDVHRAVQLLNGHSVQLRYNLDKLGIIRHKYSYSDVLHLKVLGHINRPSTCTYITKADFDVLLQFYMTPENEDRLKLIEWQQPVMVERMESNSDRTFSPESGAEIEDDDKTNKDQVDEYSIYDLYKAFVGDDLESTQSSPNNADDNQHEQISQWRSPLSSSSSTSLSISPSAQFNVVNPNSRNKVISDELQESTVTHGLVSPSLSNAGTFSIAELVSHPSTAVSNHVFVSPQPCGTPDGAVSDKAVEVNQIQVEEQYSRKICSPVTSVFLSGSRPTVESPKGVSKEKYTGSQVVHLSSSHDTVLPAAGFCNAHLGVITHCGITECAPSILKDSNIHSTCATTASRYGLMPSVGSSFTSCGRSHQSSKRPTEDLLNQATGFEQPAKKYRVNDEDVLKTLQRKETEMKILHDAYQGQIKQERENRLAMQQELGRLKDSNTALLKNIERKELEMQILHDSYKLQMDLERKKRQELENEVFLLRAKLGVSVKQEPS